MAVGGLHAKQLPTYFQTGAGAANSLNFLTLSIISPPTVTPAAPLSDRRATITADSWSQNSYANRRERNIYDPRCKPLEKITNCPVLNVPSWKKAHKMCF